MTRKEFLVKFQDILHRDKIITEDMSLETLEEWDSIATIATVVFLDKEFGVVISYNDVQSFKTLNDIMKKAGI